MCDCDEERERRGRLVIVLYVWLALDGSGQDVARMPVSLKCTTLSEQWQRLRLASSARRHSNEAGNELIKLSTKSLDRNEQRNPPRMFYLPIGVLAMASRTDSKYPVPKSSRK